MGREQVVATADFESKAATDNSAENALDCLTPREREVLGLMAHGFSNKKIAEELVVIQKSVLDYINGIFRKIGISEEDPETDARVTAVLLYQRNTPDFENPVESYFEPYEITPLTPRQKELISLIGRGCSNAEIGKSLTISLNAVNSHINTILGQKIPVDTQRYSSRVVLALISQTRHVV